jgi:hypothetical protein
MGRSDLKVAATWLGAVVVLGCGAWLHRQGAPAGLAPLPVSGAAELGPVGQELDWFDQRLAAERAAGAGCDPRRACRVASLHWERAERRAQLDYYREFGLAWSDGHEQEYAAFREQHLRRDAGRDVAAARAAARHALRLTAEGSIRVRGLWLLSLSSAAAGRHEEEVGALIEVARYRPGQAWVWRRLAHAFRHRGDGVRQELAEEQAWQAGANRPLSDYIALEIARTPYARPAPRPDR